MTWLKPADILTCQSEALPFQFAQSTHKNQYFYCQNLYVFYKLLILMSLTFHSLLKLFLAVNSADYLIYKLVYHLVETGSMLAVASVKHLLYQDLIELAVEPT